MKSKLKWVGQLQVPPSGTPTVKRHGFCGVPLSATALVGTSLKWSFPVPRAGIGFAACGVVMDPMANGAVFLAIAMNHSTHQTTHYAAS